MPYLIWEKGALSIKDCKCSHLLNEPHAEYKEKGEAILCKGIFKVT